MLFFAFKEGTDGNVLAATAKQVSKSTIQLVLACQVNINRHRLGCIQLISNQQQPAMQAFFNKEVDQIGVFYTPISITNMVHAGS